MFSSVNHMRPVKPKQIGRANAFFRVVNLAQVGQTRAHLLADILDDEIVLGDVFQRCKKGLKKYF